MGDVLELYPYQQEGMEWLAPRRRSFLFDEMGLGKTPQAICAADARGSRSMLVICPAIARRKWVREIQMWGAERWRPFAIDGRSARPPRGTNAIVINFDVLSTYYDTYGDVRWDEVIIDEGQFLMNPLALRTQYAYGAKGIMRNAGVFTLLTGSPARNNPSELWTHIRTFYGDEMKPEGIPPEFARFTDRYCKFGTDKEGRLKIVGSQNLAELRAFLTPRMLRRREAEVNLQLPPVSFEEYPLPYAGRIEDIVGEEFPWLSEMHERGASDEEITAAILESADQLATFRRLSGVAKADPVAEMLAADFETGLDKTIVFAYHRQVIERLLTQLAPYGAVAIYGGMTGNQKEHALQRFNGNPATRVLVGQLNAVGTAIDAVVAADVVFAELAWVPADNAQALKRAHRIGQKRRVRVRFPSLAGTIDETITNVLRRKVRLLAPLFGRGST